MMQSRTHNCGQLRLADAGKSVKIVGWMENIREVSSALAFIVVRDFYGTTPGRRGDGGHGQGLQSRDAREHDKR